MGKPLMVATALSPAEVAAYYKHRVPSLAQRDKEWRCPCPIHGGERDSFAVQADTGRWFCHSQCGRGGDAYELEQTLSGLSTFPESLEAVNAIVGRATPSLANGASHIATTYDYRDETGELLFQVVRLVPKGFRQRRPDGFGGWKWNLEGVDRTIYNLPEVTNGVVVWIVEGERDVESLKERGIAATCNPGGAGKWRDKYSDRLRGKKVVVVPDADDPGRRHALAVAESLLARDVAVLKVVEPPKGKDVSEFFERGGTKEDLIALRQAAPTLDADSLDALRRKWFPPAAAESRDRPGLPAVSLDPSWLKPLADAAFHGLAGEIVRLIEPHSEADPAALLLQFLIGFGGMVGRSPHVMVEADRHGANLFGVLVGQSSKARKGVSWGQVRRRLESVDEDWAKSRIQGGLASGEGLITAVKDGTEKDDPGVLDKRLLCYEPEFARVLQVAERNQNTLSAIIRQCWDSGELRTMTKKSPDKATDAHISIIAHVTVGELKRLLTSTAAANGYANRHLFCCVKRSKELPEGGRIHDVDFSAVEARLREATDHARKSGEFKRDDRARAVWREVYHDLSEGRPGLAGDVSSRAEAQVVRLSLVYALLDCSPVIRAEHLVAALEVWRYCEDSVRFIFGDALGDATADGILDLLRGNASGMTRTEISRSLGGHAKSSDIDRALTTLQQRGLARMERQGTEGRNAERWFAVVAEKAE